MGPGGEKMAPGSTLTDDAGGVWSCGRGEDGAVSKGYEPPSSCLWEGAHHPLNDIFDAGDGKTLLRCFLDKEGNFAVRGQCMPDAGA